MNGLTRKMLCIVIALLGAASQGLGASEAIYKWVDQEGVTHFAAQPPEGVEYERIIGSRDRSVQRSVERSGQPDDTGTPPAVPRMEQRETAADPDEIAAHCEQARANLDLMAAGGPVMLREEDGSENVLDADAREAFMAENQAFIDEWC